MTCPALSLVPLLADYYLAGINGFRTIRKRSFALNLSVRYFDRLAIDTFFRRFLPLTLANTSGSAAKQCTETLLKKSLSENDLWAMIPRKSA